MQLSSCFPRHNFFDFRVYSFKKLLNAGVWCASTLNITECHQSTLSNHSQKFTLLFCSHVFIEPIRDSHSFLYYSQLSLLIAK